MALADQEAWAALVEPVEMSSAASAAELEPVAPPTAWANLQEKAEASDSLWEETAVPVLVSEEVSLPFSLGAWHPAVVFPAAARTWPRERKRTVLLHELAHIARGDYVILLLVEIVRAFYWPNPLVWIAARRVALERERACDDAVIRGGTRPDAYASDLLHLARSQLSSD